MPANGLLLITPVIAGRESSLCESLNAFGNNILGKHKRGGGAQVMIPFNRSRTLHFARLALLDDPDRGPDRKRLLFATDFDGEWEVHAREILSLTQDPLALWGCCEGFIDSPDFQSFLRQHTVVPGAYYIAFRGDNWAELKSCTALRTWFQARLAEPKARHVFWALPDLLRIGTALRKGVDLVWGTLQTTYAVIMTVVEIFGLAHRFGWGDVIGAGKQIIARMGRIPFLHFLNWLLRNSPMPALHTFSQARVEPSAKVTPPGYPPEDEVHQNQLTLVTDVRPDRLHRLEAVLAVIDLVARRLCPPGELAGISTIHTVRWALLDGGKRLLMVSNYDGSWESYIDEFAEMIMSGLDALWSSAPDYPDAGAQDVAALKQFLRKHQVPANVFYSAYPTSTVLNFVDDLAFARWYGWAVRRMAANRPGCPTPPMTP